MALVQVTASACLTEAYKCHEYKRSLIRAWVFKWSAYLNGQLVALNQKFRCEFSLIVLYLFLRYDGWWRFGKNYTFPMNLDQYLAIFNVVMLESHKQ